MGKTSLKLDGFKEILEKLVESGKIADKEADNISKKGGEIIRDELASAMNKADVSFDLIRRLPANQYSHIGDVYTARAGYIPTDYDPDNLSDFFKALFINVGTPNRQPTQIEGRDFIGAAKKAAKPRLKNIEEELLKNTTKDLKK